MQIYFQFKAIYLKFTVTTKDQIINYIFFVLSKDNFLLLNHSTHDMNKNQITKDDKNVKHHRSSSS